MTSDHHSLLVARTNRGKRAGSKRLLPPNIRDRTLGEVRASLPPETGTTLAENAAVKALGGATQTGFLTLADDSGREVDALGSAPVVRSARFAGEPSSDERNRCVLLLAREDVPAEERTARFVCSMALSRPKRVVAQAEGSCEGIIARTPAGRFGFGYDPIFRLSDGRTMAEVQPSEKNGMSHRAAAYRRLLPAILRELKAPNGEGLQR